MKQIQAPEWTSRIKKRGAMAQCVAAYVENYIAWFACNTQEASEKLADRLTLEEQSLHALFGLTLAQVESLEHYAHQLACPYDYPDSS